MSVYKKIQAVMNEVSYLQKDTKSQGYTAITHNKVTDAVRDHCAKHGLLILPQLKTEMVSDIERQGKSPGVRYRCVYDFLIVDTDTDSQVVISVSAHADDFGDKAPGKALSYAMKSAMLKVFMIPSGDNDEERVQFDKEQKSLMNQLIDNEQVDTLNDLIEKAGITKEKFCAGMKITDVGKLPSARYQGAVKRLNKTIKEKQS